MICYQTICNVLNFYSTDLISLPYCCQMTPWRCPRCLQTVVLFKIKEKTDSHSNSLYSCALLCASLFWKLVYTGFPTAKDVMWIKIVLHIYSTLDIETDMIANSIPGKYLFVKNWNCIYIFLNMYIFLQQEKYFIIDTSICKRCYLNLKHSILFHFFLLFFCFFCNKILSL